MSTENTIGRDFSTLELARFASAPVFTYMASSLLMTLDDGLFLSRYVGTNALAAFTLAFPIFMLLGAVCDLLNGVSVLCATLMGEGRNDEARASFTSMTLVLLGFSILVSIFMIFNMDMVIRLLGTTDLLFPYVKDFFSVAVWYIPLMMLSSLFSRFYVPAGKPQYSMITTVLSTFCNFFFDYVFIVRLDYGMVGAAYANLIANAAVVVFGLIFYSGKTCEIGFSRPRRDIIPLLKTCCKFGLPTFMTSIALAVNGFIANQVLLDIGGEPSVSAYTITNNIQFIFINAIFGFSSAVCPVVSYAFGEKNNAKIRKTIRQIITLTTWLSIFIIVACMSSRGILLNLYLKQDADVAVRTMARFGLTVAPLSFVTLGYNILAIDVFLALNDHKTSTILTLLENMLFANLSIIVLPHLFGINGVWFALAVGEFLTFIFVIFFVLHNRQHYQSA